MEADLPLADGGPWRQDLLVIIELRQYTLHSGQRDVLVDLFERHFVESQRAAGIDVIATYHDLDDPDRFVWFRGFPDMAARKAALTEFYGHSEAWRTHGPAANATMIDSSNVLLLRPVTPWTVDQGPYVVVNIYEAHETDNHLTWLETEPSVNDFPRLPVRDDKVVVSVAAFDNEGSYREHLRNTKNTKQTLSLLCRSLPIRPQPRLSGLCSNVTCCSGSAYFWSDW
jgi:hypothetical protein